MSKESDFWDWFRKHEVEIFHFEKDRENIFDRLAKSLSSVDRDLTFEFGPIRAGVREFVISAAGIRSAFLSVMRLCDDQPALKRFHVTAFRPRRKNIGDIDYGGVQISSAKVFYHLCKDEDPQKVGILIFLPGHQEEKREILGQIGYLFLDEALGEYDMETKVGFIEIMGHDSKYFEGSHPLHELAAHFDDMIRSLE
jgi:hypothetical protein